MSLPSCLFQPSSPGPHSIPWPGFRHKLSPPLKCCSSSGQALPFLSGRAHPLFISAEESLANYSEFVSIFPPRACCFELIRSPTRYGSASGEVQKADAGFICIFCPSQSAFPREGGSCCAFLLLITCGPGNFDGELDSPMHTGSSQLLCEALPPAAPQTIPASAMGNNQKMDPNTWQDTKALCWVTHDRTKGLTARQQLPNGAGAGCCWSDLSVQKWRDRSRLTPEAASVKWR